MWRTFVWKSTTEIQPYFSSIILQASIRDNDGNTPLHLACKRGDRSCVEALTLPITAKELEDAYKYSEQTMHTHPCTQLPTDLEQRNFDGESSKNFYFLYFRMRDMPEFRHLHQTVFLTWELSFCQKYRQNSKANLNVYRHNVGGFVEVHNLTAITWPLPQQQQQQQQRQQQLRWQQQQHEQWMSMNFSFAHDDDNHQHVWRWIHNRYVWKCFESKILIVVCVDVKHKWKAMLVCVHKWHRCCIGAHVGYERRLYDWENP